MIFRKYFILTSDQRKALRDVENRAYFEQARAIAKEKGELKAISDFRK